MSIHNESIMVLGDMISEAGVTRNWITRRGAQVLVDHIDEILHFVATPAAEVDDEKLLQIDGMEPLGYEDVKNIIMNFNYIAMYAATGRAS